jgi:peroxiredoxin 5|uniref:Redoxin domain-containing protein n=1 Tax=Haptolina ericina TaxID=156174 RepID=A0A7S3AQH9_9EUKA|mmetsp:Transcript_27883/g.63027  ORF Transcript_27883/g.63027 Transcript_27883/m.63027 type:complete len:124 (+) Transcript_27883:246-617(+)
MDALKKLGIDEVIVYCVNDGAVMDAWAKDQGVDKQKFITMMGDPSAVLTKSLGMELIHPGPYGKGIIGRCKRFALYIEDGVVKLIKVSEGADDPAGDDNPEETLAPSMIKAIKALDPLLKAEL